MKKIITKANIKYVIAILLALITAISIEMFVFMKESTVKSSGILVSAVENSDYLIAINDYEVSDGSYIRTGIDPGITISNIGKEIDSVLLSFSSSVFTSPRVQVFFAGTNEEFSEANSTVIESIPLNTLDFAVDIPKGYYDRVRVDIDGSFSLKDIFISDEDINVCNKTSLSSFGFFRFLTLFLVLGALLVLFIYWKNSKKSERSLTLTELIFCFACFLFYFWWAAVKVYNYAPDEQMRFEVTQFLFNNNRFPADDELLSHWGFSYAHIPTMLCNQLGYVFMKIASVFTKDFHILLVAARMVSVCCATGTVYFVVKISKLIFSSCSRWIFICFVAFMPQFAFLASYVNNDIVALFGISIIIYAWVFALKYQWNYKCACILSLGIIICAISYYNSYAWVLFSVVFFISTYFIQNKKDYKGFIKLSGFIIGLVVVFASYTFIRHLVLYGDLLGFETIERYGEKFAIEALKPSNRIHLSENGVSVFSMLFAPEYNWIDTTWKSFIGVFGYMEYYCPKIVYEYVSIFIVVGCLGLVYRLVYNILIEKQKPNNSIIIFGVCIIMSAIVTVALSVYNSFVMDFQPQGRYCYPAFLALAIIVAKGYEFIIDRFKKNEYKYAITSSVCTINALSTFFVFYNIYLPSF